MKGGFSTVLLLIVLVAAFAYSWRGQQPGAAPVTEIPARRIAPPVQPKVAAPAKEVAPLPTFGGYPCVTSDCAEDKAGFKWAEKNVISDPDSCTGTTAAFIEGCRVYARQHDGKLG